MEKGKFKVLIAENDFNAALGIKQKVEDLGWEVTSMVSTALEAITRTEFDKPDIILMDVLLSGALNGIEAAKIISYKNKIPVIYLCNESNKSLLSINKPDIQFAVIIKPVTRASLEEAITKIRISYNFQDSSTNISKNRPYSF